MNDSKVNGIGGKGFNPAGDQPARDVELSVDLLLEAPVGIYIVQDRRFRFINRQFQEITGYGPEEALGLDSMGLALPGDRNAVRDAAVKMLKGQRTAPYEHRMWTKAGKTRKVLQMLRPIEYRGRRATLGSFMDITELEQAKTSLRMAEDKFYTVFRSSPDWAVISAVKDGFIVDVNEAFLSATGYRRQEVVGKTSLDLGIWADPAERSEMVKQLQEEGSVQDLELRFRNRKGEVRFMLWSAKQIDFGGEKCLIGVAHDITDRKRTEEERLEQERQKGPATLITQLGLTMAGSILLCFAIGYYLDRWIGTKGIFLTLFIILGVIGGGYTAYRQIMEMTRLDKKKRKSSEP